jgi:hypothetical protein
MGHCYDFDNILAEKMAILTKIVIWAEKMIVTLFFKKITENGYHNIDPYQPEKKPPM